MKAKTSRRSDVPPFYAMEVLREANERAAAGEAVLHLEVGQPSTAAPFGRHCRGKRAGQPSA
jgi:hypothetical protein